MTTATPAPIRTFPIRSTASPAFRRVIAIATAIGVLMSMLLLDQVTPGAALIFVAAALAAGGFAYRYATAMLTLVAVGTPAALFVAGIVALVIR